MLYFKAFRIQTPFAYLQFAMLYTNQQCQRVIRIFNLKIEVVAECQKIYRSIDNDAVTNLILRKNIANLFTVKINLIKE